MPIKICEVGKVFEIINSKKQETKVLTMLIAYKKTKSQMQDAYIELRWTLKTIETQFWILSFELWISDMNHLHPTKQAFLNLSGSTTGTIWQIHPSLLQWLWFDDEIEVAYCEVQVQPSYPGKNLISISHWISIQCWSSLVEGSQLSST